MAKTNLTTTADFAVRTREIDFVTRFSQHWEALREILSVMQPIKKEPGATLSCYKATMELQDGNVAEGEEIPYSKAQVEAVAFGELALEKYSKAVSVEAVNKYGARVAVQKTDDAFLHELQNKILERFFAFVLTGTLTSSESDFQMAVAMAIGSVVDKFKKLRKDASSVVVFVNTMDAYRYLGAANLSIHNAFGMTYLKDFMGASAVVLSSDIPAGKVVAIPSDNIVLYYADPGAADFKELGLDYTVQGETNLIGFHANGNYGHAVGESFALMGMLLWAEYLDAIAVVTVTEA